MTSMRHKYNEDLFEHTKMTFGEHLEELRRALFKSIAALGIGFLIGLLFAEDVVDYIQTPLRASLVRYYRALGQIEMAQRIADRAGRAAPSESDKAAAKRLIDEDGLLAEERFIDPKVLADAISGREPNSHHSVEGTTNGRDFNTRKSDLVRVLLYYPAAEDRRVRVIGLNVIEGFMVWIKGALMVGAMLGGPFVVFFIWQFIAEGLYPHEKKYVYIFMPFSTVLFLAGAAMAFFAVIGLVLDFLFPFYTRLGIDPDPRIGEWLNFVLFLPVGFGIAFQLPLVLLFLERIGIFTVDQYLSKWRVSVLVIAFLSMILTPMDPGSMLLMFFPLTILYFGGIALCRFIPRRTTPFGNEVE